MEVGKLGKPVSVAESGICGSIDAQRRIRHFFLRQCKKAIRQDGLWHNLMPGSSLLSHGETPHYQSALRRFTSEFGMGSGGTTALQPPGKFCLSDRFCVLI